MLIGADDLEVGDPAVEPDADSDASEDAGMLDAPIVDSADANDGDAFLSEPNLVAAWLFDETSGTVAHDATGHGFDGELQGDAAFTASGLRGGALSLGGGMDAMRVPALDNAKFPRSGTFSIHFRHEFADMANRGAFDSWDSTRNHVFVRRPDDYPADQFQVAGQYAGGAYAFVHPFTVTLSTWTHVVFTWDEVSQVGTVYVNGVHGKTQIYEQGPFAPDQQDFRIGRFFIGLVDEVRLYDRALSAAEAIAIP